MSSIINQFENLFSSEIPGELGLSLNLGGNFGGFAQSPTSLNGRLSVKGTLAGTVRLALAEPAPILNNLSAFKKSCVPRFLANGAELGITNFTLEAPKNEIGKRLSVTLTNQTLANASINKKYDFQINNKALPFAADDWKTLISSADLDSRNVGVRFRGDNLALSVISPAEDALRLYAASNLTVYNPDRTDFDVSQIEPIPDEFGALFTHTANRRRGLNLYWLLDYVRKQTGLASITTNIPNYEISRADFSITQSFRDSLAPFFGAYETLWLPDGDNLQIINKLQIVPEDFEPFAVTVDKFLSWQMEMPSLPKRDGFIVSFNDSDIEADGYFDVTINLPPSPSGTFGSNDYQRIETSQTFRHWFSSELPDVILRKELIKEVRTTKGPIPPYTVTLSTIGVFTSEHTFDPTGKRISSVQTHETRIPDVEDEGTIILTKTAETRQTVTYTVDPKNPRRFLPSQIVTYKSGLIAVDSDQKYRNPQTGAEDDYRQDYALLHRTGNLKFEGEMTKEFGPISQTTETLFYLGNDQYQTTSATVYYVSGMESEPISEPKAGDASIGGTSARTRKLIVYRDGYVPAPNGTIYGFEEVSAGELPSVFFIPNFKLKLAARFSKKQSGSLEIGGFSDSVKRGALLSVYDRDGNLYGKFIVEGYSVTGEKLVKGGWQLTTRLDVAEI